MTVVTRTNKLPPKVVEINHREMRQLHFSVANYLQMIEAGIFCDDDRLELIEGRIYHQMPHNAPHDSAITRLLRRLTKLLDDSWIVRVQPSITLKSSVPEPDLAIVPGPEENYDKARPTARQIAIVIEVAETTLSYDQTDKLVIYAANGIAEYWIVNLIDRRVQVYTEPRGGKHPTYRTRRDYTLSESIAVAIKGRVFGSLPVREILPR